MHAPNRKNNCQSFSYRSCHPQPRWFLQYRTMPAPKAKMRALSFNSLLSLGQRFQTVLQQMTKIGTTDLARMRRMGSKGKCSRGFDLVQKNSQYIQVKGPNRTIWRSGQGIQEEGQATVPGGTIIAHWEKDSSVSPFPDLKISIEPFEVSQICLRWLFAVVGRSERSKQVQQYRIRGSEM